MPASMCIGPALPAESRRSSAEMLRAPPPTRSTHRRPVTLFTGQWADLPLADLLPLVKAAGYDGVELACWGNHFNVTRAVADPAYVTGLWALLASHGLGCWALSNHLVGQAVCDRIDERHQAILPAHVWGDGEPEDVRTRAAAEMALTARAARVFFDAGSDYMEALPRGTGLRCVNGFTGSAIWHALYAFPPTSQAYIQRGFDDFAARWTPILEAFEAADVYFNLEVHPTEIAFDTATAVRALAAIKGHARFGFNFDASHLAYQSVDYIGFIRSLGARIRHVHMKDVWFGRGDGTVGTFGGHADFGDARRAWDFRSVGRGDIKFTDVIVALNDAGYAGPLSVEWEDARMDRVHGATEACAYVRRIDFPAPAGTAAFDAVFTKRH